VELDDSACYRALLTRDARFDGRFFVAVRTTGIYCRPICPARTPKRENVRFYRCAAAAEAAGFRACRRCHPEASPGTPAWNGTSAVVSRALRLIEDGALDEGRSGTLAARVGLGERHLRRLFQRHLGVSPAEIAQARRTHFARALIDCSALPMSKVALAAGFRSIRQFNHSIQQAFGRSPRELRRLRRSLPGDAPLVVRLAYRPPFDWRSLLEFLRRRATPGVESIEGDTYRRTFESEGVAGTLAVSAVAGQNRVELRVESSSVHGLVRVIERVRRIFDLNADPATIEATLSRDPRLRRLVRSRPGLRVPGAWDGFELAVRAILGQQVSVAAATTLAGRLAQRFGRPLDRPAGSLTHLFPTAAALSHGGLQTIGITKARAETIRRLAAAVAVGELRLDSSLGLDEAVKRLSALPGIGEWTAQYVALRAFGEPDAFPAGDLGLRRALANGSGMPSTSALSHRAESWRPWRGYAAVHLWTSEG
jgi:AraC family transcriptional regulator, regulatory protein of adaptative response / DNA-3-methyladenine glycosylase II